MDSLARANNLHIVNFSDTINEPALFRDQDHLNAKGSAIFVDIFSREFFSE
jgi:hypothetical protein